MTSSPARIRWTALFLAAAFLALSCVVARAQSPTPGGTVPSALALSVSEPSRLTRGRGGYTATIHAEVTATEIPVGLSLIDGEVTSGRRRGHLVRGTSILPAPLRAAAIGGFHRSLDARMVPPLRIWREPTAAAKAKIHLRQPVRRGTSLRGFRKLLLVTLTAAGP